MVQCFISHITHHRHQILLGHVFTLLGRLLRLGSFSVKSSATTQAHFAVPELRISTCQCTCAILVLDDEMELQMKSWLKGFIVQSCASFLF